MIAEAACEHCELPKEIASLKAEVERECAWTVDENGLFITGCDNLWEFMEDGPKENRTPFCPYCGGKIALSDTERGKE